MSYIILCNTGSDIISKIETESLEIENYILSGNERNFGPHEITLYNDNIITANNYNNTISIIPKLQFEEKKKSNKWNGIDKNKRKFITKGKNLYIGAHPNDVIQYNNNAFVTCGESNSVILYDLEEEKININIPVGRFPHNIELYENERSAFVSNMGDDSVSVIDIESNKEIKRISLENTPIKIKLSKNNHHLYVCMSYLGYNKDGYVGIISLESLELVYKIRVGFSPVDLFEDNDYLYVSNFCGQSISIVNLKTLKEEKRVDITGMPRGIIKFNEKIFVADYLNGVVNVINLKTKQAKAIAVGKEPNAMTLVD